jgi:hypothetical protein
MEILSERNQSADVRLQLRDLILLNNAMNQVCNGISVPEFETRMGATTSEAADLLDQIGRLIDRLS